MPVIFDNGEFWIDYIDLVTVTIEDAASAYTTGNINLTRPGHVVGVATSGRFTVNNDNVAAIGLIMTLDTGAGSISYGEFLSQFRIRIIKAAGTAGSTPVGLQVIFFMRK